MRLISLNNFLTTLLMETNNPFVLVKPTFTCPPIIAFMGTRTLDDVIDNINIRPRNWPTYSKQCGKVHGGFAYHTLNLSEKKILKDFTNDYDDFIVSGHSLGGAIATLYASLLVSQGKKIDSVYTFGAPRIASKRFLNIYKKQYLEDITFRYVIDGDPVSRFTPIYMHLGKEITLSPPFDKNDGNLLKNHDLKSYHKAMNQMDSNLHSWILI